MSKEDITAFLGSGTEYHGKLRFQGAVRIDGRFFGEIVSEGALIVGKDACIEAQAHVGELHLAGSMSGKIRAQSRTIIHKNGHLKGELHTPSLLVEEGAVIDAAILMTAARSGGQKNAGQDENLRLLSL